MAARRTCPACGTEKPYCIPRSAGLCNDCTDGVTDDTPRLLRPLRRQEAVDTKTALPGRGERRVRRVPAPRHTRLQPPRRIRRHRGHHRDGPPRRPTSRTPPARPSPGFASSATPGPTSPCGSASPAREPSNAGATPPRPPSRTLPASPTRGAARDPIRPCAGSRTRNPHGSGHGGEHRTLHPPPVHRRTHLRRAALTPDTTPGSITSGTPPPAPARSGCAATSATSTPPPASSCAPSPRSACRTG